MWCVLSSAGIRTRVRIMMYYPPPSHRHAAAWARQSLQDSSAHEFAQNHDWYQNGESDAQLSDIPRFPDQLSDALQNFLYVEGIPDVGRILRSHGTVTLEACLSLNRNEKSVIEKQAHKLYDLLGTFPNHTKNKLTTYFGSQPGMAGHGPLDWPA